MHWGMCCAAKREVMARDDFIGEFLHELKTPLAIIRSHLEAEVGNTMIPLEVRKTLVLDVEEISRLDSLINDMKTIIECESRRVHRVPASVVALLVDVIEFLEPLASEKAQKIVFVAAKNITLPIDVRKFKQLCFNLIHNAIKYTPPHGRIEVTIEETPESVTLCVADDGIGIAEDQRERIFERFYRIDPTHAEGTGLGLSVCAAVCALHDGTIRVTAREGGGAVFTITLPKKEPLCTPPS